MKNINKNLHKFGIFVNIVGLGYNHIRAASQLYPGHIGLFIFQKKEKGKGEDETRMH